MNTMPTAEIWLARNAGERSGRPDSLYGDAVLPYITHLCGLPVAYTEGDGAIEGESYPMEPIPAGVVALDTRRTHGWHGIGDGRAAQVAPVELALRMLADSSPRVLYLYSPRMEDQLAQSLRGLVGWFEENDGRADDFGELLVVKGARRVLENYDRGNGR